MSINNQLFSIKQGKKKIAANISCSPAKRNKLLLEMVCIGDGHLVRCEEKDRSHLSFLCACRAQEFSLPHVLKWHTDLQITQNTDSDKQPTMYFPLILKLIRRL